MKKTLLLLLLLVFTISCSNDDSDATKSTETYMKVISVGTNYTTEVPTRIIVYGTSETDKVTLVVDEKVFQFYLTRTNQGNFRWIGEVDHE
ncbi:hypothetical protein N4T20_02600 [Flavobacterium sp. TR2]|uniref:hypothetical protein n=1 Tax=Flavobacterium sp. TR2 TaxID=2977321 RepID=UPI0021B0DDDD|nr:hypothetical protein [Flavobacterium sp. TR2]UWY28821.1 hypothetical protein N4T20_02600 [Flavobacterium sp. TR2]